MSQEKNSDREALESGCAELGIDLVGAQTSLLLRFVDQIYVWNRAAGLTTIARHNAVRLHILDSLLAAPAVESSSCLDLGTGAGLPGIVLAITLPAVSFVLVESNRRRCSFLLETVRDLGLGNVRVVQSDVHALDRETLFPTVISRAFRPPSEFLSIAAKLVAPGGRVVLLMADPQADELAALAASAACELEACARFRLPGGGEPRAIARFRFA